MELESSAIDEKRLIGAVLCRAIIDFLSGNRVERHIWRDAQLWIFEPDKEGRSAGFSFPWICEHLDLCPHSLRRVVRRMDAERTDEERTDEERMTAPLALPGHLRRIIEEGDPNYMLIPPKPV